MSQLVVDLKHLKTLAKRYEIADGIDDGDEKKHNRIQSSKRFRMVVQLVDFLFCERNKERTDGLFCKMVVRNLCCSGVINGGEEMSLYMSERLFSAHKDDPMLINGQILDIRIGLWYGTYQSPPIFETINFKILSQSDVCEFCEFIRSPIGETFLNISNS
ncbi:Telomeric pathways with STn1 [Saccharomyces pastorianus]|uniref:Telomeric pathways with STn1 n=1 Tax=Saccharomyces pastorianus TaxID=27292 RepID=A0A6C1EBG2_SACPS|nr:Telomeric pathways with STn1 [Saccharomyces pastorianus]